MVVIANWGKSYSEKVRLGLEEIRRRLAPSLPIKEHMDGYGEKSFSFPSDSILTINEEVFLSQSDIVYHKKKRMGCFMEQITFSLFYTEKNLKLFNNLKYKNDNLLHITHKGTHCFSITNLRVDTKKTNLDICSDCLDSNIEIFLEKEFREEESFYSL